MREAVIHANTIEELPKTNLHEFSELNVDIVREWARE